MSKKATPAVIGAFVLTALILGVAAIFILGGGKLFRKTEPFVLYFEGGLSGLDVGAPVEYNGIRVGEVTDIRLEYNTADDTVLTPVYIGLNKKRMNFIGPPHKAKGMEYHIQQGLRAQLQLQSFVTGKLKIMLMHAPEIPVRLVGADPSVPEIPTAPTLFGSLEKSFNELPISEIILNLDKTTKMLAEISDSGEIQRIITELRKTTEALSSIVGSSDLRETLKALNDTLGENKQLVAKLNQNVDPSIQAFNSTMKEFSDAARSAQYLLDYLERHPESLLRGKRGE
jgi:paraquat-inducible protein B